MQQNIGPMDEKENYFEFTTLEITKNHNPIPTVNNPIAAILEDIELFPIFSALWG